jgi:hypothetical protein
MTDGFRSMIGVVELLSCPLFSAVYERDFHRGPSLADGTSFFAGEDIWSPQQFGVIGEVQALYDEYAILLLRRPQACGSTMCLVWRQQISALVLTNHKMLTFRSPLTNGSTDHSRPMRIEIVPFCDRLHTHANRAF